MIATAPSGKERKGAVTMSILDELASWSKHGFMLRLGGVVEIAHNASCRNQCIPAHKIVCECVGGDCRSSRHQREEQLFKIILLVHLPEVVQSAAGDDLAPRHDRHAIAQLLDLAHDVRREEDGLAAAA